MIAAPVCQLQGAVLSWQLRPVTTELGYLILDFV
jgi:hypothetical protein